MGSRNHTRNRQYDYFRGPEEQHDKYMPHYEEDPARRSYGYDHRNEREMPVRLDPEQEWNRKWEREWRQYREQDDPPREDHGFPSKSRIGTHIVLSGLLFAAVWGMFRVDHPLTEQGRVYVRAALTQSMDLNGLAAWYDRHFGGSPSFLPAMDPSKHQEPAQRVSVTSKHFFTPLQGKLLSGFNPDKSGILLEAKAGSPVSAIDKGVVVFAGLKEESGYTVILQHSDGMKSVYGKLEPGTVEVNDWLQGGETVGLVAKSGGAASSLYFAVQKNEKYVNPADVVTLD
jgi:stage IV sporulation protein FA